MAWVADGSRSRLMDRGGGHARRAMRRGGDGGVVTWYCATPESPSEERSAAGDRENDIPDS